MTQIIGPGGHVIEVEDEMLAATMLRSSEYVAADGAPKVEETDPPKVEETEKSKAPVADKPKRGDK